MPTTQPPVLLTAEDYFDCDEPDVPTELVRGEIVELRHPDFRHGVTCARIGRLIDEFAETRDIGRVTSNGVGIITDRDPDTVRGPDLCYFSFDRILKDMDPAGYPVSMPELAFEVLSPSDRLPNVEEKVDEYLSAGVDYVVVVDPATVTMQVFSTAGRIAELDADDEFTLPEVLPGFSMTVERMIRR